MSEPSERIPSELPTAIVCPNRIHRSCRLWSSARADSIGAADCNRPPERIPLELPTAIIRPNGFHWNCRLRLSVRTDSIGAVDCGRPPERIPLELPTATVCPNGFRWSCRLRPSARADSIGAADCDRLPERIPLELPTAIVCPGGFHPGRPSPLPGPPHSQSDNLPPFLPHRQPSHSAKHGNRRHEPDDGRPACVVGHLFRKPDRGGCGKDSLSSWSADFRLKDVISDGIVCSCCEKWLNLPRI